MTEAVKLCDVVDVVLTGIREGLSPLERHLLHLEPHARRRVRELHAMPYGEYLKTPEWKGKRRNAMTRWGRECSQCGAIHVPLDLHHLTYESRGFEDRDDLVPLCRRCHEARHSDTPKEN